MAAYWLSNLMDQLVRVNTDGLNEITVQQCLLIPVGV